MPEPERIPADADRPRADRPKPIHTLPQDARWHFSKPSSDQRALLRLAWSPAINRWIADPAVYKKDKTAETVRDSTVR